ncbi:DUF4362 domain-containing protein [Lederbergia wuyishanensis]|uniref:DUF4362 domain-containing protein n=1 Tax=Lederbergia wuyishanensis TaxID=1347903 RepID=A0ABU0D9X7_9BACI|nr:DUF4362 domain-containing protein [Lederbergia wuyishanensis]MCJ8008452.1 DUF4362 domain-containing protein [Lederbergia wuyishanensis]MDQ0345195.1 hypothetical protein [Lederbergia wuyishanensis]
MLKKVIFITLLIIVIFTLAACNTGKGEMNSAGTASGFRDSTKLSVKGVKNVDVLNSHGSIEGLERMKIFYDNMQNAVPSDLRIVHYTIEGDPIVTDLTYNGESLDVKYDSTRDAFGSGEITTNRCGNIVEEVNPTNTSYIAVDCTNGPNGMDEILQINYNMSQQDLFEFELKYGTNNENEINTKTNTVTKESNSNKLVLPASIKQEVYKRLVYANYLAEKDLETTCKSNESINYFLKVFINGGERELSWTACDQSPDGEKFTKIADYIIEQSEKKHSENPQITVLGYVLQVKDDTLLIGEDLNMLDYEWLKDEINQIDLDAYIFDFTILEGVNTVDFQTGDKIQATIEGSKPGRAKVKDIKKLDFSTNSN